jgi:8-oxo-dGTP pyrophosphatase MutT (NUDIX family)
MREAAVMLVINKNGLVLAISRREDPSKFGLAGGKLEEGETPTQAAIRETLEETGVRITSCDYIYTRVEPRHNNDGEDFNTHCFYAIDWDDTNMVQSSDEGVVKWLSASELTSPVTGAFPHYNAQTIAAYNEKFPNSKLI